MGEASDVSSDGKSETASSARLAGVRDTARVQKVSLLGYMPVCSCSLVSNGGEEAEIKRVQGRLSSRLRRIKEARA